MNKKYIILSAFAITVFFSLFSSQNVFAAWVDHAWVEAHQSYNAADGVHNSMYTGGGVWGLDSGSFVCMGSLCTVFRIGVNFGSYCEGRCEIVHPRGGGPVLGHGECASPGEAESTALNDPKLLDVRQINDARNDPNYEYYIGILNGNGQDIRFVFRRKRVIPPRFEGQVSSFSSKTSQSTGFTTGTKTITQSINCGQECSVRFEMDLRRQANTGTNDSGTYWVLERETKNMSIGTRRTWSSPYYPDSNHLFDFKPSPGIALGNYNSRMRTQTYGGRDVNTGEYLPPLHPGELLCESLYFGDGNGNSKLKACIFTKDVKKPEFGGEAGLHLKVRNNDTDAESNDLIYAKPQDSITYQADYQSVAQQFANDTSADKVRVNGTTRDNKDGRPLSSFLSPWRNGFNVSGGGNNFYKNYTYSVGDSNPHVEINSYVVSVNDVGKEMREDASTNVNGSVSTTPKNVTTQTEQTPVYLENNGRTITEYLYDLVANIDTGTLSDYARVRVPYNFRLESTVSELPNDIYYAGEEGSFKVSLAVKTRWNSTTRGEYATKVHNSKWQLALCPEGVSPGNYRCYNSREYTDPGTMNSSGSMSGGSPISRTPTISIPDDTAGSRYCLYSRIYPSDSGYDTNLNSSGSGSWSSWSNQNSGSRRCFTIAKKPSIQIWGGSIYSAGKLNTSISKKNNLNGVSGYSYNINGTSSGGYRIFGSWGENGVISGGSTGFSSGASMGYGNNNDAIRAGAGNTVSSLGGSNQTDFCKRIPLSLANVSNEANTCGNAETVLGIGSNSIIEVTESQKDDIITRLIGNVTPYWSDNLLNGGMSLNNGDSNVFYNYSNGGTQSIGGNNEEGLIKGRIRVFAVRNGNINIDKNLTYESGPYANFEEVPKTIIMAIGEGSNGNININCGVNQIDAMLIASGKIDTCKDVQIVSGNRISNTITASNQLKINGAIIAKTIEPKRTYGAAKGVNSVIPAEIINYDPTFYLWGKIISPETGSESGSAEKTQEEEGELTITNQHEIAPRL